MDKDWDESENKGRGSWLGAGRGQDKSRRGAMKIGSRFMHVPVRFGPWTIGPYSMSPFSTRLKPCVNRSPQISVFISSNIWQLLFIDIKGIFSIKF